MGRFLRRDHGVDHVIFGFSFYEGRFTAVPISESGQFGGPWRDNRVEAPLDSAYSWFFRATGLPHFVLDLQGLPSVPESQWIEGPLPMRQIGCCYQESNPGAYFVPTRLPVEYDAIIYFETSFPTQLLAYLPPSDWEGNP